MALTPDELALVRETVERAMADTLPEQVVELRRQRDALKEALKDVLKSYLTEASWGDGVHEDHAWTVTNARRALTLCEQTPDPD